MYACSLSEIFIRNYFTINAVFIYSIAAFLVNYIFTTCAGKFISEECK